MIQFWIPHKNNHYIQDVYMVGAPYRYTLHIKDNPYATLYTHDAPIESNIQNIIALNSIVMWFLHINDNFYKESLHNMGANILFYHTYIPEHMYILLYMAYYVYVKKYHTDSLSPHRSYLTHPPSIPHTLMYGTATDCFNSGTES